MLKTTSRPLVLRRIKRMSKKFCVKSTFFSLNNIFSSFFASKQEDWTVNVN